VDRKGLTVGLMVALIVGLILIFVYIFIIKDIIFGGEKLSACETRGGTCRVVCHHPDEGELPLNCDESEDLCCYDPSGPKGPQPIGDPVTMPSGSLREGHKIYVYGPEGQTIQLAGDTIELEAGNYHTYYFAAEGPDVGVCYASIMQLVDGNTLKVLEQGGEKRIRLDRRQCLLSAQSKEPLTFHLQLPEYSDDRFYIQFIVFDKEYGTDAEKFQALGGSHEAWNQENRVADYKRWFEPGAFPCDLLPDETCLARDDCVYCEFDDKCYEAKPDQDSACKRNCQDGNTRTGYNENTGRCGNSCSVYHEDQLGCIQRAACVWCQDATGPEESRCLDTTYNSDDAKDLVCKQQCYGDAEGYEGYYRPDMQNCGSRPTISGECFTHQGNIGACVADDNCVYCGNPLLCLYAPTLADKEDACRNDCYPGNSDSAYNAGTGTCLA